MIDILGQTPARPVLLKLQAVNFTSTVSDTADLSTMRGSSLALLRGPAVLADRLRESLPQAVGLNAVYQGASEVLIELRPMAGAGAAQGADADDPNRPIVGKKPDDPIQPYGGKNKGAWLRAIKPWTSRLSPSTLDEQVEKCLRHLAKHPKNLRRGDETLTAEELSRQFRWIMHQEQTKADLATAQSLGEARLREWCEALAERARRLVADPVAGYPLDLFTFVAAAAPLGTADKWPVALAHLDSRIGAEQHRRLTLSLPPEAGVLRPASSAVCTLTRTHPSGQQKVQGMPVSSSVARRRRSGRQQKQLFYEEQLGHCAAIAEVIADTASRERLSTCRAALAEEDIGFAHSFADIVGAPPDGLAPNVRGKLAVVYLDGNNLGKRRQAAARTLDGLRRFSAELTVAQGGLLAAIVDWLLATPEMANDQMLDADAGEADRRFRFETLLWGGDEMAFVLPAWHGFSFVSILLDAIGTMRLPSDDAAVTHGLGVVFGSAKSPIGGLLDAANQLAGAAKAKAPDGRSVERNDVQMLALEGIDRAALDIMALRDAYFQRPSAITPEHFSMAGETWASACAAMRHADDRGCRTQLHRLIRQAIDAGALGCGPDETSARALRERLGELGMRDVDDELLASGLLGRGSTQHPFIPVWHYLTLADYAVAEWRP